MKYIERSIDDLVCERLGAVGAILIRGPKGCGKTETARQHASSEIIIDDSVAIETAMQNDPGYLLQGATPRLIDEWQEQPALWNTIRHEVDRRKTKGQFILTGSSNPGTKAKLHTGAMRFGVIDMRPFSSFESGYSNGEVSLQQLLSGAAPRSTMLEIQLPNLAQRIVKGGWPGNYSLSESQAIISMNDYVELLAEVDVSRVSEKKRDPVKVRRVLQSLARNISTECKVTTIAADAGGENAPLSEETVNDYLDALTRLMINEDLPAWNTHIRSGARLRKAPKRQMVDPSLAVAVLGLDSEAILADLEYLGFLFESMVIRDLRVYAQRLGGKLYHYRDSNGLEVDAVLELRNGAWAAFEIKLGFGAVDKAAETLTKFSANVKNEYHPQPLACTVICGSGFAHRRKDGINVVPLDVLGY